MKITVDYILNKDTGDYFTSEELLGNDKVTQFKLRHEIEKGIQKHIEKYVCAVCLQKIKLRAGEKNRFHFAHLKDSEYCPIKTDTKYTKREWLSIFYHGAKESEAHIKLKNMLYDILTTDDRFSDVKLEKAVTEIKDKIKWKKPDVQNIYNNQKYIFEIHLSHTFLSVIVARELFYEQNEMPLFWIFDKFKPDPDYIKAFQGDIFAHNNCNVMVLDQESRNFF
jgi:competence CoiA-like predicted nuclease